MKEEFNGCGGPLEEIGTSFTSSEPRSRIIDIMDEIDAAKEAGRMELYMDCLSEEEIESFEGRGYKCEKIDDDKWKISWETLENAAQAYAIASQQNKKDDARQYEYAMKRIREAAELGRFERFMYEYLSEAVCKKLKEKGFKVIHEYPGTTTIKWRKKKKRKKLFKRKILPLPKPKKIFKRGLYELMWGAKKRDYGERCSPKKGKKKE